MGHVSSHYGEAVLRENEKVLRDALRAAYSGGFYGPLDLLDATVDKLFADLVDKCKMPGGPVGMPPSEIPWDEASSSVSGGWTSPAGSVYPADAISGGRVNYGTQGAYAPQSRYNGPQGFTAENPYDPAVHGPQGAQGSTTTANTVIAGPTGPTGPTGPVGIHNPAAEIPLPTRGLPSRRQWNTSPGVEPTFRLGLFREVERLFADQPTPQPEIIPFPQAELARTLASRQEPLTNDEFMDHLRDLDQAVDSTYINEFDEVVDAQFDPELFHANHVGGAVGPGGIVQ